MKQYLFFVSLINSDIEEKEIIEIDDDVFNALSDEGKQEFLENYIESWARSQIVTRWEENHG